MNSSKKRIEVEESELVALAERLDIILYREDNLSEQKANILWEWPEVAIVGSYENIIDAIEQAIQYQIRLGKDGRETRENRKIKHESLHYLVKAFHKGFNNQSTDNLLEQIQAEMVEVPLDDEIQGKVDRHIYWRTDQGIGHVYHHTKGFYIIVMNKLETDKSKITVDAIDAFLKHPNTKTDKINYLTLQKIETSPSINHEERWQITINNGRSVEVVHQITQDSKGIGNYVVLD